MPHCFFKNCINGVAVAQKVESTPGCQKPLGKIQTPSVCIQRSVNVRKGMSGWTCCIKACAQSSAGSTVYEPVHSGWKPSHSGGMLFDSIGVWKQTSSARWPFTLSFLQIEVMTFLVPLTKQTVLLGMRTTTNVCFPFLFFQYSPVFQSSRECSAPEKTVSKPALLSFCEIKWEWMSLDTYVSTWHRYPVGLSALTCHHNSNV